MPNSSDHSSPQKKILLASLGSRGELTPMLWAAKELQKAGHSVTLLANPFFRETIESESINFQPVGTLKEWVTHFSDPRYWDQSSCFPLTIKLVNKSFYQFQEAIESAGDYDAIIHNPLSIGAGMVAQKDGKPSITLHPTPYTFWMRKDLPVMGEGAAWIKGISKNTPKSIRNLAFKAVKKVLNKAESTLELCNTFRKKLGIAPAKDFYDDIWARPNDLHIGAFPSWYAPKQSDWPKKFQTFDFPTSQEKEEELSPETKEFLNKGSAPILWGFGNNPNAQAEIAEAIKTSKQLGMRAIIISPHLKGQEQVSGDKDILQTPFEPYSKIIDRCRAFVHQGSIGAISNSLNSGTPQLITPRLGDQFDNAYTAQKLGVAKIVPYKKAQKNGYFHNLKKLLRDSKITQAAKHYQKKTHSHTSKSLADWVEKNT